jgi:hypothetical protein
MLTILSIVVGLVLAGGWIWLFDIHFEGRYSDYGPLF